MNHPPPGFKSAALWVKLLSSALSIIYFYTILAFKGTQDINSLPIIGLLTSGDAMSVSTTIRRDWFGLFLVTTRKLSTTCTQKPSTLLSSYSSDESAMKCKQLAKARRLRKMQRVKTKRKPYFTERNPDRQSPVGVAMK